MSSRYQDYEDKQYARDIKQSAYGNYRKLCKDLNVYPVAYCNFTLDLLRQAKNAKKHVQTT